MGSDAIARGTRVGNDQEHADRPRSPSELAPHDGWDQSRLDVEPADAFLQVGEPCLRLEDRKSAGGFVPGDGVRDTALTVLVERQFDLHRPAGASQDSDDLFDDRGMGGVDERVASRALVARVEMHRIPSAAATFSSVSPPILPQSAHSIRETSDCDTPALAARSTWRQPRLRRTARTRAANLR